MSTFGNLRSIAAILSCDLAYPHGGRLRSTVGGTSVFGRRTEPVLRSPRSRRVTTMWVNRPLQVSQLGQLSLSFFRGRQISRRPV